MNPREQKLAIIMIVAIATAVAGAGAYLVIIQPLGKLSQMEQALTAEVADLEKQAAEQQKTIARLRTARVRSLPADETLARREYVVALTRMIEASGIPKGYTIIDKKVDQSPRAVPEISKGKPIYTRVAFEVACKKTDIGALKEFLHRYYEFGILHQITALTIKKEEDPSAKNAAHRDDLTITFTTEAIIVEGADNRKTLLPVPTAFAAVGGGGLYMALAINPEAARGVKLPLTTPTLSPLRRDYDLIVRKDPFNGPLPETPYVPFKLAKISDVKVKTDERHDPVKVSVTGDGSVGAKVTALASGSLFAEGALEVDPKTLAIKLPRTSATEGTATVAVIATSADGTLTEKTSFRVSIDKGSEGSKDDRPDISKSIILIGATPRSDGTAWARVKDNANRLRYNIDVTAKGITVAKDWYTNRWKDVGDYEHPAGVLVISDDNSKTHRTFKVLSVDAEGLIVADLKPESAAHDKPKSQKERPGRWDASHKQGHAAPLSAFGGNMAVAAPQHKLYRWPVGQSLSAIKPLSEDEKKKVLHVVEATSPVSDVAKAAP